MAVTAAATATAAVTAAASMKTTPRPRRCIKNAT